MDKKRKCLAITTINYILHKEKRNPKRKWARDWLLKREKLSHANLINELRQCPNDFRSYLRMNEETFTKLLKSVEPLIGKQDTVMRTAISAEERLSATLRFLATGRSYSDLQFSIAISKHALSKIIPETCLAIIKTLKKAYLELPKNTDEWLSIANNFNLYWNFPNCGGALDGKHIRIVKPPNSGSYYYNYKGYHSVVLMALVNAEYEFLYIHVGTNGRVSDGGVIENTSFYEKLKQNSLNLPSNELTNRMNFVIIGDDAFSMSENLLKPYGHRDLEYGEKIFNYRLSRARRIVENAFGILAARFRIFHTAINMKVEYIDIVVMASCILHNFLRKHCRNQYIPLGSIDREDHDNGEIIPGDWRNEVTLSDLQNSQSRNATQDAKECRNKYKEYFVGNGKVPWQDRMI